MKNRHLKRRGKWWHFKRRVPEDVATEFGRAWVEHALKTSAVEDARRQRDKLNTRLERDWQRIRDTRKRKSAIVVADDEVTRAYAAFAAEKDEKRDIPSLADFYLDDLDDLASTFASGIDSEDLDEAREMVALTPEGQRLGSLINAAQGKMTISAAGEIFLAAAAIAPSTKSLYRRAYSKATQADLSSPEEVTRAKTLLDPPSDGCHEEERG